MNASAWRWFPHYFISIMGIVFAVNFYMIYDAYSTFPGVAGADGFDLSNQYTNVLKTARQQAALGWHVQTEIGADDAPLLLLTGRDGTPLQAPAITAKAERPLGPSEDTKLVFRAVGGGRYQADKQLAAGQWDIMLAVHAEGQQYVATRRVIAY